MRLPLQNTDIELPQQLVDASAAKTVGELLEIDFPVAVGEIDTKRLSSYATDADMSTYDPFIEDGPPPYNAGTVRTTKSGYLRGRPSVDKTHTAFQECAAITRGIEDLLLNKTGQHTNPDYRLKMRGSVNPFSRDMRGGQIIPSIRTHIANTPPSGRHYTASSEQPDCFVSHADTLKILKDLGYDRVLGLKLNSEQDREAIQRFFDNSFTQSFAIFLQDIGNSPTARMTRALYESATPRKKGELTAYSSLTFYTNQGRLNRGRTQFNADAHDDPDYRYQFSIEDSLLQMIAATADYDS